MRVWMRMREGHRRHAAAPQQGRPRLIQSAAVAGTIARPPLAKERLVALVNHEVLHLAPTRSVRTRNTTAAFWRVGIGGIARGDRSHPNESRFGRVWGFA